MSDDASNVVAETTPATPVRDARPWWVARWFSTLGAMLVLGCVAWMPYSNALKAGFIFDSEAIIKYDPRLRDPKAAFVSVLHPSQSGEIWTSHYWHCESAFYDYFYRPLISLSYSVNYWPHGYQELPPSQRDNYLNYFLPDWAVYGRHLPLQEKILKRLPPDQAQPFTQKVNALPTEQREDFLRGFWKDNKLNVPPALPNLSQAGWENAQRSFHFVNWLLHFFNVLLVYALCRLLASHYDASFQDNDAETDDGAKRVFPYFWRQLAALFAAAIFAVHPVHTEVVTNIVGRADILATFFVLVGFFAHRLARQTSGWKTAFWLGSSALLMLAGLLTKESAIVLIALAVLYDISLAPQKVFPNGVNIASLGRWTASYSGHFAVLVLFFWVRWVIEQKFDPSYVDGLNNPLVDYPPHGTHWWEFGTNINGFIVSKLTALKVVAKQLFLLVWPVRLSPDYSYNAIPVFSLNFSGKSGGDIARQLLEDSKALAALGALVGLVVFAIRTRKRHSLMMFLALGFLVSVLPTSNLILEIGTIMAERFLYLPSVWFCVFVALAIVRFARRASLRPSGVEATSLREILPKSALALAGGTALLLGLTWQWWWSWMPIWLFPQLPQQMRADDWFAQALFGRLPILLIGVFIFLSFGKTALNWGEWRASSVCFLLAGVVQIASVRTFARNIDWQTTPGLWKHAAIICPESSKAHVNYANALFHNPGFSDTDLEDAIRHSEIAWSMKRYATFGANLGAFYVFRGDRMLDNALKRGASVEQMNLVQAQVMPYYQRAVEVLIAAVPDEQRMVSIVQEGLRQQNKPLHTSRAHGNPAVYKNLGTALVRVNRLAEASVVMRHAIALEPIDPGGNGRLVLADTLRQQAMTDTNRRNELLEKAAVALMEIIILEPNNIRAGTMLKEIYAILLPNQEILVFDTSGGMLMFGQAPRPTTVHLASQNIPEMVKEHIRLAMMEMMNQFAGISEKNQARAIRDAAVTAYNFPPEPFDEALNNPQYPKWDPQLPGLIPLK